MDCLWRKDNIYDGQYIFYALLCHGYQAQDARYVINPSHGTLRIEDVQMTDEGNYACRVNTTSHPVILSANAHLYVESKSLCFANVLCLLLLVHCFIRELQEVSRLCLSKEFVNFKSPSVSNFGQLLE